MRWVIAENKLDVQQRTFVQGNAIDSGCHWIKGFPGSGKSVLLLYTLKRIKNRFPNAKVAFVVFTQSMIEMFKNAFIEAGTAADVMTMYQYLKTCQQYDFVLCDEVQDMTPRILNAMKSRCQHVIVAGDENQSIYDSDPQFHEPTLQPSQLLSILSGTSHELTTIHRLTKEIIRCVNLLLPNMNIFGSSRIPGA